MSKHTHSNHPNQTQQQKPNHPNFPPGPYPIIYIRGFALGLDAIQATTETPYMGFNLGATKHRQAFDGQTRRLIFPSPLIRLMQDHGYTPTDIDPHTLYHSNTRPTHPSPQHSSQHTPNYSPQSIIIHRYYDRADPDFAPAYAPNPAQAIRQPSPPANDLNPPTHIHHPNDHGTHLSHHPSPQPPTNPTHPPDPTPPTILQAAHDLKTLIDHLHQHTHMPNNQPFAVHLVAHSMGGLIIRCLLQHPELKYTEAASLINKVFTYATPHGGITLRGLELPRFIQIQHAHHFNRRHLAQLFDLPQKNRSDRLNGDFPPHRFFCLIGTNHQDYAAGKGIAKHLIGPMSDGLVKIARASVHLSPRAHIHRTHGGAHGIVNSEAGFNNLSRFLFGTLRLDATFEADQLPLPPALQAAKDQGHRINAGYFFEAAVAPRANPKQLELAPVYLTERRKTNASAIFRGYEDLIAPSSPHSSQNPSQSPSQSPPPLRHPQLFSIYLDPSRSVTGADLVLSVELTVSATDYAINGRIQPEHRLAGQRLFHEVLRVRLFPTEPQEVPPAITPAIPQAMPQTDIHTHTHTHTQASPWPSDPQAWTLGILSIAEPFQETDEVHLLPTGTTTEAQFVLPIKRKGFQGRVVWRLRAHR